MADGHRGCRRWPGSAAAGRDKAPLSAAQAVTIILYGVPSGAWRVLVGEDAHRLDEYVRAHPADAYDHEKMAAGMVGTLAESLRAATERLFATTAKVLSIADADGVPPSVAADRLAERRMSDVGRLRGIWLGTMGSA